jgi:hypothetical protein
MLSNVLCRSHSNSMRAKLLLSFIIFKKMALRILYSSVVDQPYTTSRCWCVRHQVEYYRVLCLASICTFLTVLTINRVFLSIQY